jgi:hypothetical protein
MKRTVPVQSDEITMLRASANIAAGKGLGANALWGFILGGVGLLAALIAIISRLK